MKSFITYLFLVAFFGNISAWAQQNQNEILANHTSSKYTVYKLNAKKKFEKVKKSWPIEFSKNGDKVSKVLVKRSGILDESFEVDVPGYPAYFQFQNYRLSFLKNYAAYYEWNGKQQAKVKYIFVKEGKSFSGSFESTNSEVATYAKSIFANQSGARAEVKEQKAAMAEADRKANSLQGKSVLKIELKLLKAPSKVAHFSEAIDYGIVATLKDGSTLKTQNLGGKIPWEDFKLSHVGCSNTVERVKVDEDASKFPNDIIELKVTSVYHSSLKASKKIPTTNNVSIQVNRNGFHGAERHTATNTAVFGASQRGGDGHYLTVKVKTVKHKQNGTPINKIEVYDETDRKIVARYKLALSTELIINSYGGAGQWGSDGSSNSFPNGDNGGAGGNGGNITILKDPSVSEVNISANNDGGKGGAGGKRYNINGTSGTNGARGSKGSVNIRTQSVSLTF